MRVITIRDIAQQAGVSISTVSRVLNNRPDVQSETRERVMRVVEKYNYTQNNNARNLKQRSMDFIAIIVRGRRNIFLTSIAERILEIGSKGPIKYLLRFIDEKADEFESARQLYAERRLCGVIFLGSNTFGQETDIERLGIPCVFTTIEAPPLAGVSSVSVNNYTCGRMAADYLFSLGHRRIAYAGAQSNDSTGKRFFGLKESYAVHGEPFDETLFIHSYFSLDGAYNAATELLSRTRNFTALFAASDTIALGAIRALNEQGLSVPGDVSIVGFDGIEIGQYSQPRLTTISQPVDLLAQKSAELMERALDGGPGEHLLLDAEFIIGGSTRRIGDPVPAVHHEHSESIALMAPCK